MEDKMTEEDKSRSYGWLSPTGKTLYCAYGDHDKIVNNVLKKTTQEIEKTWVRLMPAPKYYFEGRRLTAEQRNYLLRYGYEIDEKIKVTKLLIPKKL